MSVLNFLKLDGTQSTKFQVGAAAGGVQLKNDSGNLDIRNGTDSAWATANVGEILLHGTTYNVGLLPSSSATATYNLTMPVSAGSAGQVLQTDGTGVLSWVNSVSGATDVTLSVPLAFGSAGTVSIGTLPANAVILTVQFVVDTAWDSTPSMSVGIVGNLSKYMGSGDVNLNVAAGWEVSPNLPADTSSEALEITYAAASSTVGSGRLLVSYCVPL